MKANFHNFSFYLEKHLLNFAEGVEWDDEQWNQAYTSYKVWLDNCSADWVRKQIVAALYTEFALEFYQDATEETHDYWLKSK
jgi:hypothetical protein